MMRIGFTVGATALALALAAPAAHAFCGFYVSGSGAKLSNEATQVVLMRQGTRTVCKPVQVQTTQTVCKDMGGWDTKSFVDCCGCTRSYQCWVPNVVTEQVPVTVWKAQMVEEPYTYQVVTCRPEARQVTRRVAKPVYETMTRNVTHTVAVPKIVERQVPQTSFRCVVEQKVVNYTAMVATRAQKQVTVPVCTMVPKTVSYVPTCGGCGGCGGCGW